MVHVRPDPDDRSSWYDSEDVAVDAVGPGFDPAAVGDADCAVVDGELDAMAVLDRLRSVAPDLPAVVRPPPDAEWDPLVFAPAEDRRRFEVPSRDADDRTFAAFLVGLATDGPPDDPGSEWTAKTDALHDAAVELVRCETETEVFENAVEAADDLLELEQTGIYVAEGSELVPVAVGGGSVIPESEVSVFDVDEGGVGYVYRTGESLLVEDMADSDVAEPTDDVINSGMAVPLGEFGVFLAVGDEVGDFDDRDLTLLEILAAHVTTAVDRVRSRERIEHERDRFAALFEHVPDPVVIAEPVDGVGRIRAANPAFEETFGVDADAIEGDPIPDHVALPPGDERIDIPEEGVVDTEIRREAADGAREFLLRGFPIEVEGEPRHVAILTDITERNRRRRELERKTRRLEEFASIVSHDLRNPIAAADGWIEQGLDDPGLRERALEEVATAVDRMDSLVDDLLTLAREGWSLEETEVVDGRALVERAWEGVDTQGATLRVEWAGTVEADRDRAIELFENLFRNSVEHGADDGRNPADPDDGRARIDGDDDAGAGVVVTVGSLDDGPGVYVADDGPGIDPEIRDSLFERGATTDEGGTGLGLAIVSRIADAHGWSVSATDSADGGARFEIRFEGASDPETAGVDDATAASDGGPDR